MILDTSAVVAYVLREPGFERIETLLTASEACGIGTPTLVELGIVMHARLPPSSGPVLEGFLRAFDVVEVPFGSEHWGVAVDAFRRFGKGRHPARLNLGDCFSYATARLAMQPLLCVGDDFPLTDLALA